MAVKDVDSQTGPSEMHTFQTLPIVNELANVQSMGQHTRYKTLGCHRFGSVGGDKSCPAHLAQGLLTTSDPWPRARVNRIFPLHQIAWHGPDILGPASYSIDAWHGLNRSSTKPIFTPRNKILSWHVGGCLALKITVSFPHRVIPDDPKSGPHPCQLHRHQAWPHGYRPSKPGWPMQGRIY
jgi:hypothetical protein